jgi:hypothetical protein
VSASVTGRFVPVDGRFDLEHAGPVVRIWCNTCDKHELLPDDDEQTVDEARKAHRCGPRTSDWDCGGAR